MVSLSGALSGAGTGALVGGVPGAVIGGLGGLFLGGKKGKDVSLEDQRSPEQIANQQFLSQLGLTGSSGGLNLGEAFQGSLGNFDLSGQEQQGLSQLFNQSNTNQNLQGASDTFSRLSESGLSSDLIDSFRKEAGKDLIEGGSLLDRESAITGSRFGTGLLNRKADLQGESEDIFQKNLLSGLFQQQGINLQGAQGLAGVGQQQQGQDQQNLQNLFNFGGAERNLKNQEAQVKFNEFNRQRGEELKRIDIAQGSAQLNPNLGISSIPGSPSPFSSLINSVLGGVGQGVGNNLDFTSGASDLGKLAQFGTTKVSRLPRSA